jgi:hypothetical protein
MIDYQKEIINKTNEKNSFSSITQIVKNRDGYKKFVDDWAKSMNRIDYKIGEILYCIYHNIKEWPKCGCGNDLGYQSLKRGFTKTCNSKDCLAKSKKKTIKEKYGDHYMKDPEVRKKFNNTMKERYGVEWAQQNKDIQKKSIETYKNNPNKEEIIKNRVEKFKKTYNENKEQLLEKINETRIKKYGSIENYHIHIQNKIRETSIRKYGLEHHMATDENIKKRIETFMLNLTSEINEKKDESLTYNSRNIGETGYISLNLSCSDCGNSFDIGLTSFRNRYDDGDVICKVCNPKIHGRSKKEVKVFEFIESIYDGEILVNKKFDNNEIDIYLPKLKLGFEFNGLYWHSDLYKEKNFHKKKTEYFSNMGISIIHIWEDDWDDKCDIVK